MRQILRRYWRHMVFVGALFLIFFAFQVGRLNEGPERVSKLPVPVRIDQPAVYVRGERCLLTESKAVCSKRVP